MSPIKDPEKRRRYYRDRMRRIRGKAKQKGDQAPVTSSVAMATPPQNPVSVKKSKNEFSDKGTREGEGGTPAWVVALIVLALIVALVWFVAQLQSYYLGW